MDGQIEPAVKAGKRTLTASTGIGNGRFNLEVVKSGHHAENLTKEFTQNKLTLPRLRQYPIRAIYPRQRRSNETASKQRLSSHSSHVARSIITDITGIWPGFHPDITGIYQPVSPQKY